jgi:acyl-coenzyme A synthetase/AMP-(fatty) acid ligase
MVTVSIPVWLIQTTAVLLFAVLALGVLWWAIEMAWNMGRSGLAFNQLLRRYMLFVYQRSKDERKRTEESPSD